MSNIYKEVMTKQIVGHQCDICGQQHESYETVTAQHSSWGNDSCDSSKTLDVCSDVCFVKAVKQLIEDDDYKEYESTEINDIWISTWREIFKSTAQSSR